MNICTVCAANVAPGSTCSTAKKAGAPRRRLKESAKIEWYAIGNRGTERNTDFI